MSHLPSDRLAALADEEPTGAEAAHLADCAACARERAAHRTLVAMAHAEREAIGLPLTRWEAIAGALDSGSVGASRAEAGTVARRQRVPRFTRTTMRAAAALLLVVGGAAVGRISAGATLLPRVASAGTATGVQATASGGAGTSSFESVEEARLAQARSEALYQRATAFLAEHDSDSIDGSPTAYRSRLAALDQVISTTREAMRQAPHDPVINGYYLTTIGQREATLRQLNTVLPASLRSNSF